ncbi:hypothetical protein CLI64_09685 [Nostoc sp. CENA543]|uniref:hypothetical protein n=1 Tax=Nostoc sp. CENA543 TaxID=1869241 RepID=UPI000CA1DB5F|nr:hypothetical protein [Nostoc sp. CENA543]AUT00643.1 hypothetical protein CLI64_09685 [Nostoc sp. CENA543]
MFRRIYLGIIALPIFLYNAGVNQIIYREVFQPETFPIESHFAQKTINSWQIAGREQQPEDCLIRRECTI